METLTREKAIEISGKTYQTTDKWGMYKTKHQYIFLKANIQTDGLMVAFGGQKKVEGKFRIFVSSDDKIYIMKPRERIKGILFERLENPIYELIN